MNHRKMSRSWSSGSKCQLSLTEEGSVSFIQYSENVEINTMEYLPIYPKKGGQVKSKAKRKRNSEMKNSKTQWDNWYLLMSSFCVIVFIFSLMYRGLSNKYISTSWSYLSFTSIKSLAFATAKYVNINVE